MKTYKISVLGDVMCESPLLDGRKQRDGSYDFDPVFMPLKGLLDEADYRIANLESPIAGEELGYAKSIYSFNTPESIVTALQKIGIDAVSTANNHAADRGAQGFYKTLDNLDRLGMPHTGTYRKGEKNRIHYFTVGDTKVAMIAYTCAVNGWANVRDELELDQVNFLFRPGLDRKLNTQPQGFLDAMSVVEEVTGQTIPWEDRLRCKLAMGISLIYSDDAHCDESILHAMDDKLRADVEEAKRNADLVIYLPHVGGQFNVEPGSSTTIAAESAVKLGVDAVFGSHAHTTQKAAYLGDTPVFYSLGNVSMSSNTMYSQKQTLPMYGLIGHLYVAGGKIVNTTYSVFKITEKEGKPGTMRVVPVDELYASLRTKKEKEALVADVEQIVTRVSGASLRGADAIRREYRL